MDQASDKPTNQPKKPLAGIIREWMRSTPISDERLRHTVLALLLHGGGMTEDATQVTVSYASLDSMAAIMGVNRRTVGRRILRLKEAGYIQIARRQRQPNIYRLHRLPNRDEAVILDATPICPIKPESRSDKPEFLMGQNEGFDATPKVSHKGLVKGLIEEKECTPSAVAGGAALSRSKTSSKKTKTPDPIGDTVRRICGHVEARTKEDRFVLRDILRWEVDAGVPLGVMEQKLTVSYERYSASARAMRMGPAKFFGDGEWRRWADGKPREYDCTGPLSLRDHQRKAWSELTQ